LSTILGYFSVDLFNSIRHHFSCDSSLTAGTFACNSSTTRESGRWGLLAVALLVLVAAWIGLAVWSLRPLAALTQTVQLLGPQNLSQRSPVDGARRDEVRTLTVALNSMLDRIANGYEGQRRFAANASHELRTPLAVQRALIEVGLEGPLTEDQLQLLARQLLQTNERNEHLIEGLLVLSESDRGLATSTPQKLHDVAAAVIDAHRQLAGRANVTLELDSAECVVPGEQVLLERLITNLVQNAITYNVSGGYVRVWLTQAGTLSVSNSGTGVPAEAVDGLFEPFRRLNRDRVNHSGGAGLGLTIVRSIVQAHRATLHASPSDDGGLSVNITFPATA
jgi:MYXO-CTERM domain-containing protein